MFQYPAFDDIPASPVVEPGMYFDRVETKNRVKWGLMDLQFEPTH